MTSPVALNHNPNFSPWRDEVNQRFGDVDNVGVVGQRVDDGLPVDVGHRDRRLLNLDGFVVFRNGTALIIKSINIKKMISNSHQDIL